MGSSGSTASRSPAGILPDGTAAEWITLANRHGLSARILTFGATLQSLRCPDRAGLSADIILGHDDLASYVERPSYLGVTVGRYANRIAQGRFTLDDTCHQLPVNDRGHCLHGGDGGFDRLTWRIIALDDGPPPSVTLVHRSADGENGFPGCLTATVTYTLSSEGLDILFQAHTTKPTIVNLTNHALFDLSGGTASDGPTSHLLTIPASAYTPVDPEMIPTGELRSVADSPFDFRAPRRIADRLHDDHDDQLRLGNGYDHNFVLDKGITAEPRLAARLEDPLSGRVLEVMSTEPGIQFYSGNAFDGTLIGKGGRCYRKGDGIALEPQKFPDSPNHPTFPSARVDPGRPYRHRMIYRLSTRS